MKCEVTLLSKKKKKKNVPFIITSSVVHKMAIWPEP